MLHSLRQVAFLVRDMQEAEALYRDALGMESCRTGELTQFGMTNSILHAGDGTFVELLQPTGDESAGKRFLDRRGEAPYLLIFETKEFDRLIDHLTGLGVRITGQREGPVSKTAFIHPSSTNGAFLEIVEVTDPAVTWPAGGDNWQQSTPLTRRLRQSAVLVKDLDQATQRWEEMFGIRPTKRFQVGFTDLEIAIMPLGDNQTFIELAQPTSDDSPSARFLNKYGEGIYLTIYQIDDSLVMDAHLEQLGARFTTSRRTDNYTNTGFNSIWIHPGYMKGAFTQLSQVLDPVNPWPPAGDEWYK